jgi:hypothetical protein
LICLLEAAVSRRRGLSATLLEGPVGSTLDGIDGTSPVKRQLSTRPDVYMRRFVLTKQQDIVRQNSPRQMCRRPRGRSRIAPHLGGSEHSGQERPHPRPTRGNQLKASYNPGSARHKIAGHPVILWYPPCERRPPSRAQDARHFCITRTLPRHPHFVNIPHAAGWIPVPMRICPPGAHLGHPTPSERFHLSRAFTRMFPTAPCSLGHITKRKLA